MIAPQRRSRFRMDRSIVAATLLSCLWIGFFATAGCMGKENVEMAKAKKTGPVKKDAPKKDPARGKLMHKGSRLLASKDLIVEVMDPASADRYNIGQRFTPVAAVLRVAMGGQEYLFSAVKHDRKTGHAGLASEFDLSHQPPGHKEAKISEGFVKVGVGVLKKDRANYAFYMPYKAIEPAKTTVKWGMTKAEFHQVCKGVGGYAYELRATVKVAGKTVTTEWSLKNTGRKAFTTTNYVHNFFRMGDKDVGPDYVVSFPFDFKPEGLKDEQTLKGRDILFTKKIPTHINGVVKYPKDYKGPNSVTVRQTKTGQTIKATTSIPGTRVALHASKTYVCPEQFIEITLKPGQTKTWTRTHTFGKEGK